MGIGFNISTDNISIQEKSKMFLFARWIATCYSSYELNHENGRWWINTIKHFELEVFPNYIESGLYDETLEYIERIESLNITENICEKCGAVISLNKSKCQRCEYADLPF